MRWLLLGPALAFGKRIVVALLVLAGVIAIAASTGVASTPTPIWYYRSVDADTLIVSVTTHHLTWARVTAVEETDNSVSIAIRSSTLRYAMADVEDGYLLELTVDLRQPLGNRSVFDGSDGFEVRCRGGGGSGEVICLNIAGGGSAWTAAGAAPPVGWRMSGLHLVVTGGSG
jgi:hypothetical protein